MVTQRLRKEADAIWRRIFEHPFVVRLYRGDLPIEKFKFYVLQDFNYLVGLTRALSVIASKAEYPIMAEILELAREEITTEMKNYEELLSRLGFTLEDAIKTEPTLVNSAYMDFMLSTAYKGRWVEGLTALLPCFWSYAEIAEYHKDALKNNENEIYREWAQVYLSDEYLGLVKRLRELIDGNPGDYERMKRIFITGSKFELAFWEMAWRGRDVF
ncbi:thiaminase II [Pyrococcus kukulkanii]|uniref:Transcriptional regulator n=1 Tax=Pyrococcus kukulkanii TaxID=1609559 RepID=A0A127B9T0_9EURY|nr:thiaminase II [Pyrococcus kukulkanii]AMM54078.1 transcriptional regulator [Pyrococcus kukulkanii]